MRTFLVAAAAVLVAACSHTTAPAGGKVGALDPFLTVRVRNQFDVNSDYGKTPWAIFALLTGPQVNLNGISPQGEFLPSDLVAGRNIKCIGVQSDSIGTRILAIVALGNPTTKQLMTQADLNAIIAAWQAGNHTLPPGVVALTAGPTDAWDSDQFRAGHGLTRQDPIKWGWDWTGNGVTNFYERAPADTGQCDTL